MESSGVSDEYNPKTNAVFPAKAYLERYIDPRTDVAQCQTHYLKGFHSFYENHVNGGSMLEFGGGPTLLTLISAAKHVESITFAEYAETNRNEVIRWKNKENGRKATLK